MDKNLKRRIAIEGLVFLPILFFASFLIAAGEPGIGFFIIIFYAIVRFLIWSIKALEQKDGFRETQTFNFLKGIIRTVVFIVIIILIRQPVIKFFNNSKRLENAASSMQLAAQKPRQQNHGILNNNPVYSAYYDELRSKIDEVAYSGYNQTETGEVHLAFTVRNDGSVNDIRVIEGKSSTSVYLREIAIGAIKGAAPFPAFPTELNYPQLDFNIILSYKITNE